MELLKGRSSRCEKGASISLTTPTAVRNKGVDNMEYIRSRVPKVENFVSISLIKCAEGVFCCLRPDRLPRCLRDLLPQHLFPAKPEWGWSKSLTANIRQKSDLGVQIPPIPASQRGLVPKSGDSGQKIVRNAVFANTLKTPGEADQIFLEFRKREHLA